MKNVSNNECQLMELLARFAYYIDSTDGKAREVCNRKLTKVELANEWIQKAGLERVEKDAFDVLQKSGIYIYVFIKNKNLYFCCRGTKLDQSIIADLSPGCAGYMPMEEHRLPIQSIIKSMKENFDYEHVYLSGHSLGGALVQMLSEQILELVAKKEIKIKGLTAATFQSPGVSLKSSISLIKSLDAIQQENTPLVKKESLKFMIFNHTNDIVANLDRHAFCDTGLKNRATAILINKNTKIDMNPLPAHKDRFVAGKIEDRCHDLPACLAKFEASDHKRPSNDLHDLDVETNPEEISKYASKNIMPDIDARIIPYSIARGASSAISACSGFLTSLTSMSMQEVEHKGNILWNAACNVASSLSAPADEFAPPCSESLLESFLSEKPESSSYLVESYSSIEMSQRANSRITMFVYNPVYSGPNPK